MSKIEDHVSKLTRNAVLIFAGIAFIVFSVGAFFVIREVDKLIEIERVARLDNSVQIDKLQTHIVDLRNGLGVDEQRIAAIARAKRVIWSEVAELGDEEANLIAASIVDECAVYNVDIDFALAVMRKESKFSNSAVSPTGAVCAMQLMPSTINFISTLMKVPYNANEVKNDVRLCVKYGIYYLAWLKSMGDGSHEYVLASYNGGPKAGSRYLLNPKDSMGISGETREYVPAVKKLIGKYRAVK